MALQVKSEGSPKNPNSESVGLQSLGRGIGDTKMHAPNNRNSPGTLQEPFAGLQSWANLQKCMFLFPLNIAWHTFLALNLSTYLAFLTRASTKKT